MDAFDLLAQGKRDLVCGEIQKAVSALQDACRKLAEKFGETADECAEAYFVYGKALLELSRMESGVLGNALDGIEGETDEKASADDDKSPADEKIVEKDDLTVEEKEKISDEILDAMMETDEEVKIRLEKEKKDGQTEETDDKKEEKDGEKEKDEDKKETAEKKDEKKDEKKETAEKKDEKKETAEKKDEKKETAEKKDEKKETAEKKDEKKETEEKKDEKKEKKETEEMKDEKKETEEMKDEKKETEEMKDEKKETKGKTDEKKEEVKDGETKEADKKDEKMETKEVVEKEDKKGDTDEDKNGEGMETDEKEGDEEGTEGEDTEGTEGEVDTEEDQEGEGSSDKKEEEDVSNLQIAWEMLELSKIIYKRNNKTEYKMKLADTHLKLGEVGLETEQYETAIGDFKECLRVQKEILDADDRALAETYYQLGLACSLHAQYDEAISYYRNASNTIETKIAALKVLESKTEGKGKEQANPDDPLVKSQKELKDLEAIIPDILAKIEDVLDEKRSAEKVKQMVKENITTSSSMETDTSTTTTGFDKSSDTTVATEPSGPAKDITHLVRKKRKPEDDDEDSTKKAKTDENGSGDHVNGISNGHVNGEATKEKVATS